MKAIIPVAGLGSKLRPHTHTQPIGLVPVAGKPIIEHIIESVLRTGIQKLIFVIGHMGDKIETYIRQRYSSVQGLEVSFVTQDRREGLAQAILMSESYIDGNEPLLIVLGDTIVTLDMDAFLNSEENMVGVKKVDQPGLFGVAELDEKGTIKKLVEKPKIPKSNLALVGIYKINSPKNLIDTCKKIIEKNIKSHDEYQLTDALMLMIQNGHSFRPMVVDNWFDCGRKDNLLEANALIMSRLDFKSDCGSSYEETIIIPPVSIAKGCKISHSIIGPNVTIGDEAVIRYSVIKNTIVGSYSELGYSVLENSIIGNDSVLIGPKQSLNIGDSTEINFGNT